MVERGNMVDGEDAIDDNVMKDTQRNAIICPGDLLVFDQDRIEGVELIISVHHTNDDFIHPEYKFLVGGRPFTASIQRSTYSNRWCTPEMGDPLVTNVVRYDEE